jgi:hypothetical protein
MNGEERVSRRSGRASDTQRERERERERARGEEGILPKYALRVCGAAPSLGKKKEEELELGVGAWGEPVSTLEVPR